MASPDNEFYEGFDKYGTAQYGTFSSFSTVDPLSDFLSVSEWPSTLGQFGLNETTIRCIPAKVGKGLALSFFTPGFNSWSETSFSGLGRPLPTDYRRSIGGITLSRPVSTTGVYAAIFFGAGSTPQISIRVNPTTGRVEAWRGFNTLLLGTSSASLAPGVERCIEWDITFHNSTGIVKVWIDGVIQINLSSQNTSPVSGNIYNTFALGFSGFATVFPRPDANLTYDHLYLWSYLAAGGPDNPVLTNPLIDTSFVISDHSTTFTRDRSEVGYVDKDTDNDRWANLGGNQLYLQRVVADQSGTLDSITLGTRNNNTFMRVRAVLYADSSGTPGSLISASTTDAGGIPVDGRFFLDCPFSSPPSIVEGTAYWIGFILNGTGIGVAVGVLTGVNSVARGITFPTAPNPAGSVSTVQNFRVWGNVTGSNRSFTQLNQPRSLGNIRFNSSDVVGNADVFNAEPLSSGSPTVYGVAVKAVLSKSDGGARTADINIIAGSTTSPGSNPAVAPSGTPTTYATYFPTNPDTGLDWTAAQVSASRVGVEVNS